MHKTGGSPKTTSVLGRVLFNVLFSVLLAGAAVAFIYTLGIAITIESILIEQGH